MSRDTEKCVNDAKGNQLLLRNGLRKIGEEANLSHPCGLQVGTESNKETIRDYVPGYKTPARVLTDAEVNSDEYGDLLQRYPDLKNAMDTSQQEKDGKAKARQMKWECRRQQSQNADTFCAPRSSPLPSSPPQPPRLPPSNLRFRNKCSPIANAYRYCAIGTHREHSNTNSKLDPFYRT